MADEIAEKIPEVLTNQEILQIFAQYPLNPIAICEPGTEPVQDVLEGVNFITEKVYAEHTSYPVSWIKLILKPLSKMSLEESLEVAVEIFGEQQRHNLAPFQGIEIAKSLQDETMEFKPNEFLFITSILKRRGYETKNPFGSMHWAKNKTLSELGLTITPTI